ncbi:MAG TPA: hypothetical protein VH477_06205 [Bryobacteraceae bacterium]
MAELAAREAAYEPPSETVQEINAAYRSVRFVPRLREIASLARLVFDSFSQPSLAGIRAAAQASRQLIHESEPFTIDLRLEADAARKRIYLAGQIMNSRNPDEIAGGIDVVLLKGSDQISKTETLPSGEFELSFDVGNADDLELFLNIRGQRAIAIKLPELET